MSHIRIVTLAVTGALAFAAPAMAATYPPPGKPGAPQTRPKGKHRTLRVCAHGTHRHCYRKIQTAVNKARAGDTVRVPSGTYHEAVSVRGAHKRYIRLLGNVRHPGRVVLDGDGKRQNGVFVNGANEVTIRGFTARDYKANGFFMVNVTGYTLRNLVARHTGTYGVYAFNSKGGLIADSKASENNDSGFYIGQTPPQTKPIRSMVRNVSAFANVIGFSGTNMRYVTITKSKWFNNGVGIVPNALDSEKYAPPEDNVIVDNDVFWNNFNYFVGAPFPVRKGATDDLAYPVGTGILLFGGRRNRVENNRVFGNYLMGIGAVEQILLKQRDAADLIGNRITGNVLGKGGADLNGRDILYTGNGSDNCISGNIGADVTLPADRSTFQPCPFTGANAPDSAVLSEAVNWTLDSNHEKYWVKHDHTPISGITPLEHWSK